MFTPSFFPPNPSVLCQTFIFVFCWTTIFSFFLILTIYLFFFFFPSVINCKFICRSCYPFFFFSPALVHRLFVCCTLDWFGFLWGFYFNLMIKHLLRLFGNKLFTACFDKYIRLCLRRWLLDNFVVVLSLHKHWQICHLKIQGKLVQ